MIAIEALRGGIKRALRIAGALQPMAGQDPPYGLRLHTQQQKTWGSERVPSANRSTRSALRGTQTMQPARI